MIVTILIIYDSYEDFVIIMKQLVTKLLQDH